MSQMWFIEQDNNVPGMRNCLEIERVLHHARSKYQDVLVFKSVSNGVVLVLDGCVQITEFDECAYQEMMALVPLVLTCHPCPKRVLIVGGGDGAVLRHVVKDPAVQHATLCEIDGDVIEVSKKYFPEQMTEALSKPLVDGKTVDVRICDGLEHVRQIAEIDDLEKKYDVIITDSSDPEGPALALFGDQYYRNVKKALRGPYGIFCSQGECMWIHGKVIRQLMNTTRKYFENVAYYFTSVPSYPSGSIGFVIGSLDAGNDLSEAKRDLESVGSLKFYSKAVHRASFALPKFVKETLMD